MDYFKKKSGFTLIELTISITIIALLVAAVTAATSIKRQSELNHTVTDISMLKNATKTFMEKYTYLPGDFPLATTEYGASQTLNGDGDFKLDDASNNTASLLNEKIGYWQHLSLEGLIKGSYSLAEETNSKARMAGPILSSIYFADTMINELWWQGDGNYIDGDIFIRFSKEPDDASVENPSGIITAKEAYYFDNKFDDNSYNSGNIRAREGINSSNSCINSGSYNLTNNDDEPCVMYFFLGLIN